MHAYKKEKESRKKRTLKTESRNGVTARKVHSKCKKITIYVRGSGQGREGAGFMDGCVDVRVCDRDEEKPVYYIIFSTLDIAADVYYVCVLGR